MFPFRLTITYPDGTTTTVDTNLQDELAFEDEFDIPTMSIFPEGLIAKLIAGNGVIDPASVRPKDLAFRQKHVFFLAWHAQTRADATRPPLKEWLGGIADISLGLLAGGPTRPAPHTEP